MATSVVAICNLALDMLGSEVITSLDDASKAAGLCNRNYELARDAALRAYPWGCAVARSSLAALSPQPSNLFGTAFELPVDCLRVLEVEGELVSGVRWRVEGATVVADGDTPLNIRYVRKLEDPTLFDPLLVQALAARLAAMIAYPLTGNRAMSNDMLAIALKAEADARRIAAREQSQDNETVADAWSGARFTPYGQPASTTDLFG